MQDFPAPGRVRGRGVRSTPICSRSWRR